MKTFKKLLPAVFILFYVIPLSAQEMKAERHENSEWYTITYFKWEAGKMEDAKKIINEYFKPSGQDAGLQGPVMEVELMFSDWDHMVVFPMEEGLDLLEWKTSPNDVKWIEAMQKRAGGEENGKKIFEDFDSCIKDSKSQLARKID